MDEYLRFKLYDPSDARGSTLLPEEFSAQTIEKSSDEMHSVTTDESQLFVMLNDSNSANLDNTCRRIDDTDENDVETRQASMSSFDRLYRFVILLNIVYSYFV